MSLKTIFQSPAVLLVLAIVTVSMVVLLGADVLLGVIVVIPFIASVWWVRNRHLTLLREAIKDDVGKRKLFMIQNKEL